MRRLRGPDTALIFNSAFLTQRVTWRDYSILTRDCQSITARVYKPKYAPCECRLPVYLFFHGGGHLFGGIESEDSTCCRIIAHAPEPGLIVVHVNYRHTPEFTYPIQFHDAWDSFEWLAAQIHELGGDPERVIVGGISAGAGLSASVALKHTELGSSQRGSVAALTLKGQVLCIPWLVLHADTRSFTEMPEQSSLSQNADAPVLPVKLLKLFSDLLEVDKNPDGSYIDLTEKPDEVVSRVPKASFLIAGRDPLRDEGLYFADKLAKNGLVFSRLLLMCKFLQQIYRVQTKVHIFQGLPHAFRRFNELPSSKRWDELVVESIKWCLDDVSNPVSSIEKAIGISL